MIVPSIRRPAWRVFSGLLAVSAALLGGAPRAADVPAGLAGSGVALVPADAAFFSATLRAREQYDRFVKSNAYAALQALPAVKRALDSLEEQRTMPGNPLSMADAFLQFPENAQAAELLADMVATDTFVYGEPSCVAFAKLVRKLAAVARAIGAAAQADRRNVDEEVEVFEKFDDDEAAVRRATRGMRCQVDVEADLSPEAAGKRMVVQALVDNGDLLVVPDVVWGFRTTKAEAARAQLARLEALAKTALADDAGKTMTVVRKQVAGGDFVVLTVEGESLPWDEFERAFEEDAGDIDGYLQLVAALKKLDFCLAIGIVGDRVIVSIGDSTAHLEKLSAGPANNLLTLPALAPLVARADKPLTGINYMSADACAEVARMLGRGPDAIQEQVEAINARVAEDGLPEDALEDGRELVERFAAVLATRMPEPGPWTAFSWLNDSGYEGHAWDWSRNQPVDGSQRLDLLEHAGGAPLAVAVTRLKSDPEFVVAVADFVGGLWPLTLEHGADAMPAGAEFLDEHAERLEALVGRLGDVVRGKLVPALADGQVGLVLDGKSRTKKPQRDLPASADPLPIPEPAIVLPLGDAKLFRDGLSDLFALADDAVAILRDIDPGALPPDYRVPDPEKAKVERGTVWSFPLTEAGLDAQVRPAIGVGDDVAVFSLAPNQAARMLGVATLETGSQLSKFEEPLAGAAAADVAGLVEFVKPWILYFTRYGCVQEREGEVDADAELGAADETERARDAIKTVDMVLQVATCLRAAVAETAVRDGAVVIHWQNVIRDLPAK